MPLFPGQFVDADRADAIEVAVRQPPANGVLDAAEDGVPARMKAAGGLLPRQHLGPPREEPDERVGRLHLARRPGHHLDGDAATRAVDATHRVHEPDRHPPERHEREVPRGPDVVAGPLLAAIRTDASRMLARTQVQVDRWVGVAARPFGFRIDKARLRLQPAQDRFQVHRVRARWCESPIPCTMHSPLPADATGARRAARGRDAPTIPRCGLRDERRASDDQTPTYPAKEPKKLKMSAEAGGRTIHEENPRYLYAVRLRPNPRP